MGKEEELEFISVNPEDDDNTMTPNSNLRAYNDNGGYQNSIGGWMIHQSKHPSAILFHLLFKTLALFFYVFGSWITSNFILIFVICIILLAFDFWTVKNISGRLLVGLRWWSYVRDDGTNEWIFESLEDTAELSPMDARIFWWTLYVTPVIWSFYFIVGVIGLKFEYLPIVIAAISMSCANIIGYMKCSSSAKNKMKSMMEQGIRQGSLSALENSTIRSWIFDTLLAVTTTNTNQPGPSNV